MTIGIFGKTNTEKTTPYLQNLINELELAGLELMIFSPFFNIIKEKIKFRSSVSTFNDYEDIKDKISFLISVGGDGTLLNTITLVRNSGIPILGVNTGRMGFLSSISKEDVQHAMKAILNQNYKLDERILIKLKTQNGLFGDLNFGLNEMCVYKKDPYSLLTISAYIDNKFLNSYWADGLIIATPTGSTAYSLSCGGPIIVPGSENFIITPIATHNLTVRPIVIPDKCEIRIKVEGRDTQFFVSLDSRFEIVDSSLEMVLVKEDFKINIMRLANENFYRTIREKLNWGLDIRNYRAENL